MPQPLVFITRTIPKTGIDLLKKKKYRLRINPHKRVLTHVELQTMSRGASAILSLLTDHINADVMDAAGKQLQIIANYAVGFDNVQLQEARKRNIVVTNTPGVLERAVAEHTFALAFACAKKLLPADRFTRAEKYKGWDPMLFLGLELYGKTLGIIGAGRIGALVAQMGFHGFGMKIAYHDVNRNSDFESRFTAAYCSLPRLLKRADVVTLHVPLLPQTRHLIGTHEFRAMKKTAILINTARGPVVDEKALTSALKRKQIFGAGIDVYECEPAIDCDIKDDLELKVLDNVIMTPHTASATHEARDQMSVLAAKNIIAVLEGKKPLSRV